MGTVIFINVFNLDKEPDSLSPLLDRPPKHPEDRQTFLHICASFGPSSTTLLPHFQALPMSPEQWYPQLLIDSVYLH